MFSGEPGSLLRAPPTFTCALRRPFAQFTQALEISRTTLEPADTTISPHQLFETIYQGDIT